MNGRKEVGFKKEKPAQTLAKSIGAKYETDEVRVAKHGGKYYAVIDTPSMDLGTQEHRTAMDLSPIHISEPPRPY